MFPFSPTCGRSAWTVSMSCWTSSLNTTTSSSGRTLQRTVKVWPSQTRYPIFSSLCYLLHKPHNVWWCLESPDREWNCNKSKYIMCVCQPFRVRGCILTLVERMDEEFTKIMQNTDPHSQGELYQKTHIFKLFLIVSIASIARSALLHHVWFSVAHCFPLHSFSRIR